MKPFINFISEELEPTLNPLPYGITDLEPCMSKEQINYHYNHLARQYLTKLKKNEGDTRFNKAGVSLHNTFFQQFQAPNESNPPTGASNTLITSKFGNFNKFKEEFKKFAMEQQGSGWVYLCIEGLIHWIKNHEERKDIALLIDWWEHSWALDYKWDKEKYLDNVWKIINWNWVNCRINKNKS